MKETFLARSEKLKIENLLLFFEAALFSKRNKISKGSKSLETLEDAMLDAHRVTYLGLCGPLRSRVTQKASSLSTRHVL